jgi:LysM repeat protein
LSDATCALLPAAVGDLGKFVRTPDKKFWQVLKGRRHFANLKLYLALRGDGPRAVSVSDRFVDALPIGKDAVAPAPTPTTAPTADPNPTTSKTYVIKSGDSLSSIAIKFKTTVAKLMSLNGIKNANLISVGQKIKLP